MPESPQLYWKEALIRNAEAKRVLAGAEPKRMKHLLRLWVKEVRLEPERHTVHIWYRVPYLQVLVAGAGFVADSERVSVVTARWAYEGVRQGERRMRRVGVTTQRGQGS